MSRGRSGSPSTDAERPSASRWVLGGMSFGLLCCPPPRRPPSSCAPTREPAAGGRRRDHHALSRQMLREGLPGRLAAREACDRSWSFPPSRRRSRACDARSPPRRPRQPRGVCACSPSAAQASEGANAARHLAIPVVASRMAETFRASVAVPKETGPRSLICPAFAARCVRRGLCRSLLSRRGPGRRDRRSRARGACRPDALPYREALCGE